AASGSGREAGGTIGKIISPHAAESLIEAEPGYLPDRPVEAAEPRLERPHIVQPETVETGDPEARRPALLAQSLWRQQHAAREHMGLDEVRSCPIGFEQPVC